MRDPCGRFTLAADMNLDGAVTISDVGLWIEWLYRLPATVVVGLAEQSPGIARFFEITCATGQGAGGVIFASVVWFFLVVPLLVSFALDQL